MLIETQMKSWLGRAMIELIVNGENRRISAGATLAEFIASLQLEEGRLAVERNREIVPKSTYETVILADGDQLEIVHFIGGG